MFGWLGSKWVRCHNAGAPESSWSQLDEIELAEVFVTRVPTLRKCPPSFARRLRQAFSIALSERLRAKLENDVEGEIRTWKLFVLIPSMLLHRPRGAGSVGRSELAHRFEDYQHGRWADLMRRGLGTVDEHCSKSHSTNESEEQRRGRAVLKRVQQGQVSRAR